MMKLKKINSDENRKTQILLKPENSNQDEEKKFNCD